MQKWESLVDRQAINGHVLKKGQVIEGLTDEQMRVQTDGGLRFTPVDDKDKRDVLDVSNMPEAVPEAESKEPKHGKKHAS